jgi:hypothetical protein
MAKLLSPREISRDLVKINLGSFLTNAPGCDLEWIKLIIHISGITPEHLEDLFYNMSGLGDEKRYKKIFKICRNAKFNCKEIK